jgi:lipopolysaccharide export system permease protein
MKKIDWYITQKFLVTFFFSIFLFSIIAVVIDASEKTDDFVNSGWSFQKIVTDYYFAFIPHIIALLFPLFVFIAVIFFTSKMAGRSEIIAIIASGTTFSRFLRPYFLTGMLLALLLWVANQFLIPHAEVKRTYFEDKYVHGHANIVFAQTKDLYFRIDSFTYAGVRYYDTANKTGGPFFMHTIKNNALVYNLRANNLRWDTSVNKWKLSGVFERNIRGLQENISITPERTMNFNFKPFDLSRDEFTKDKLTTPELKHFIKLEELRGSEGINSLKIEKYRRDATPVSVIILTLIGATVASRKVRGGSGLHLAIGFVTAAAFILMDRFSTIFSTKGNFPPLIAAWTPNLFFSIIAYIIYRNTPK